MDFLKLNAFLLNLREHNNKDWFDQNKMEYTELRNAWISFVQQIIDDLGKLDSSIGNLDAKKCIFRINKDVRFSKDKSPYKTNFGAIINKGGKKEMSSGYYIHFDPKEIFIAGGTYLPEPKLLASIRQEIDYNLSEFESIVKDKKAIRLFGVLSGDKLVRPPKGYLEDNLAVELLKHKSFLWTKNFNLNEVTNKKFQNNILEAFAQMKPLNDFLNRCGDN
ncbi:MAG: DUF2461 domain-containing protein [bacterium]|nr:DUF2461 domain-containing protein [bacterium]